MESRLYWEENGQGVKFENYNSNDGHLNFATGAPPSEDEADYVGGYLKKGKVSRQDPMSHRIIEKRRRDRMNNCLADLSRLIPPDYLKKGRGRVEKTEIIEMAIRHLKYLQERANAADQAEGTTSENFRMGYQECLSEVMRFLVDSQGYGPADGLCVQLVSHLHRHCDALMKGDQGTRDKLLSNPPCSSETTSSCSGSSHGYAVKPGVITATQRPSECNNNEDFKRYEDPAPPAYTATDPLSDPSYDIECDESQPLSLELRRKPRDATLRNVRKDDYLHSYKFKNSIERRFSRSQDCEAHDMRKQYKRRRLMIKHTPSTSTSASNEDTGRDTSPPDTSSESPNAPRYVPVFALHALGKYYVPLNVEYSCLIRFLGSYDLFDPRAAHAPAPLHPITINVNFQPYVNFHGVKHEPPPERDWRPA